MTNSTTTVDEDTLKRAPIGAPEEEPPVNAVLRVFLASYAGVNRERSEAERWILESPRESTVGSGGRTWTRDDFYGERLGRYGRG